MLSITGNSEMESFFLAKGLAQILNKQSDEVYEELIQIYHRWLSGGQNTNKLYRLVCSHPPCPPGANVIKKFQSREAILL